jgi:quercetin dioxygenase-like cupin family protein
MPIVRHAEQPMHWLPRSPIRSRSIVTKESGAESCTLWEQFMEPGAEILPHHHDVEEIITILAGAALVTISKETSEVAADTTIFIPAYVVHSLRNDGAETVRTLAFLPTSTPRIYYVDVQEIVDATRRGDVGAVAAMLERGPWRANCYAPETGDRLLHLAVANGDASMVHTLLRYGVDGSVKNDAEQTPLVLAQALGQAAIADLLREHT